MNNTIKKIARIDNVINEFHNFMGKYNKPDEYLCCYRLNLVIDNKLIVDNEPKVMSQEDTEI